MLLPSRSPALVGSAPWVARMVVMRCIKNDVSCEWAIIGSAGSIQRGAALSAGTVPPYRSRPAGRPSCTKLALSRALNLLVAGRPAAAAEVEPAAQSSSPACTSASKEVDVGRGPGSGAGDSTRGGEDSRLSRLRRRPTYGDEGRRREPPWHARHDARSKPTSRVPVCCPDSPAEAGARHGMRPRALRRLDRRRRRALGGGLGRCLIFELIFQRGLRATPFMMAGDS